MTSLLFTIPAELIAQYQLGNVQLFGAILKEVATGKIVGHVQQTVLTEGLVRSGLGMVGSAINPLNLLATAATGGVTIWQNQQIKGQLTAVQQTLSMMQGLQVGGLLLSGLGLGVSVVGFAVLNNRLQSIGHAVEKIDEKLGTITKSRREDDLTAILTRIDTYLTTVDSLGTRNRKQEAAERAEEGLRQEAAQILSVLQREVSADHSQRPNGPDISRIQGLTSMYRLAHEASYRALLMIEEVSVAGELAAKAGGRLLDFGACLSPDAWARQCASNAKTADEAISMRRTALAATQAVVSDVRQSAMVIASQNELAQCLVQRGASGRLFIEEVSAPSQEPLLYLPG